jgi:hypothetical protein
MVACIDFFEMSEICRPKFIVRHSKYNSQPCQLQAKILLPTETVIVAHGVVLTKILILT